MKPGSRAWPLPNRAPPETPSSVSEGYARTKLLRWCKEAAGAVPIVNFDSRCVQRPPLACLAHATASPRHRVSHALARTRSLGLLCWTLDSFHDGIALCAIIEHYFPDRIATAGRTKVPLIPTRTPARPKPHPAPASNPAPAPNPSLHPRPHTKPPSRPLVFPLDLCARRPTRRATGRTP